MLKELRVTLEEEQAVEQERLEAQKRQDIERVKAEFEEELKAERSRFQGERKEKLNSLKYEVTLAYLIFNFILLYSVQFQCLHFDLVLANLMRAISF